MDVSMDWRDRQQSSERQRLEYGEQSTWEEKKMQKKIPKICTDTLESLTDCKAAHKLGVKYMRQSKEWQLRKKKKKHLRVYTRLKGIQILFSQREKPHWTPEACKRASRNTIP